MYDSSNRAACWSKAYFFKELTWCIKLAKIQPDHTITYLFYKCAILYEFNENVRFVWKKGSSSPKPTPQCGESRWLKKKSINSYDSASVQNGYILSFKCVGKTIDFHCRRYLSGSHPGALGPLGGLSKLLILNPYSLNHEQPEKSWGLWMLL